MKKAWIVIAVVVAVFILYGLATYNSLVTTNEAVTTQWAQV